MRRADIHIGEPYAVVASRGYQFEKHAFRALVEADLGQGWWRVRFDQPLVDEYGTLKPASQAPTRKSFVELEVQSSQIIDRFDDHAAALAESERKERDTKSRLEEEKDAVVALLARLEDAIKAHIAVEPPSLVTLPDFVFGGDGLWRGKVFASTEALELLALAVESLDRPTHRSALEALVSSALTD